MSKPTAVTLKKKDQKLILRAFKKTEGARTISEVTGLARRQVMLFLEEQGLKTYSLSSYK